MTESELSPLEILRAEAIAACTTEKNLEKLEIYAEGEKLIRIYGVHPAGIGYACAIAAYLWTTDRDVAIDTYFHGDEFNMYDVVGKKVLVVSESASHSGIPKLGEMAAKAVLSGYIDANDFRLLVVDSFDLLGIEDIFPTFRRLYTGQMELDFGKYP